jgi:hypothetical protein
MSTHTQRSAQRDRAFHAEGVHNYLRNNGVEMKSIHDKLDQHLTDDEMDHMFSALCEE